MRRRQRKKNYTKVLLCTKIKDRCSCGSDDLDIDYKINWNTQQATDDYIVCHECLREYKYKWINHRSIKLIK